MYCHPYRPFSPDDITAAVKEIVASGFQAFKMDPMLHNLHVGNASYLDGEIAPHAEAAALEILPRREKQPALGSKS
ncbi:MAG: hypothetical protein R2867_40350 [Caldilineaceae bacterium]